MAANYTFLLLSILLLTGRAGNAQIRRGTGLVHHQHEVVLYSYTSRLVIRPEAREQFIQASRAVAALARKEATCQSFYYYEDADAPNTFLLAGAWTTHGALHAHLAEPYMAGYFEQLTHWLAVPSSLTFFDIAKSQTMALQAQP